MSDRSVGFIPLKWCRGKEGSISYLSQGGKDRLKISTRDGIWCGNFLNFRRLNVLDYYIKFCNNDKYKNYPLQKIQNAFSQIIKNNANELSNTQLSNKQTVVIAPIANSLGFYYNLSELTYLWVLLINYLASSGFIIKLVKSNGNFSQETDTIIQNIIKNSLHKNKLSELDLNIIDFTNCVQNADVFIGVRSGICDLINFIDSKTQKRLCIYPPKINYCFGLGEWGNKSFIEYELPENFKVKNEEVVMEILLLLNLVT